MRRSVTMQQSLVKKYVKMFIDITVVGNSSDVSVSKGILFEMKIPVKYPLQIRVFSLGLRELIVSKSMWCKTIRKQPAVLEFYN